MARKKTTWTSVDKQKFRELCGCFATRDEVCATFGISPKTLNRLINEYLHDEIAPDSDSPVSFQDAFQTYSASARGSLRRKQFELAMNGDKTMLIFLGKNYLGQTDREPDRDPDRDHYAQSNKEVPLDSILKKRPKPYNDAILENRTRPSDTTTDSDS